MRRMLLFVWLIVFLPSNVFAVVPHTFDQTKQWCFNCSFLWLDSVATLSLTVEPQSAANTYRIILQGEGRGFVGWLNGGRHQYYESLVSRDAKGRVSTLAHSQQTQINHQGQRINYGWELTFDQPAAVVNAHRLWGGQVVETQQHFITAASTNGQRVVGDFLSALFTFMGDSSQPLAVGLHYDFWVFHLDGDANLNIEVTAFDERQNSWQCLLRSDSASLPGDVTELIFYCDDKRIPLFGGSDGRFGGVAIQGISCEG